METRNRPAGWYKDPTGRFRGRWFDGEDWTTKVLDGETSTFDPEPPPTRRRILPELEPEPASAPSPPGWYPDPAGTGRERWWDGQRWVNRYNDLDDERHLARQPGWLALGAAGGAAVGSLLPWASVRAGIFSATKNGLEGDGSITLTLALVLAALAAVVLTQRITKPAIAVIGVVSLAILGVAAVDFVDLQDREANANAEADGVPVDVTPGAGLILVGIAGAAGVAAAGWLVDRSNKVPT